MGKEHTMPERATCRYCGAHVFYRNNFCPKCQRPKIDGSISPAHVALESFQEFQIKERPLGISILATLKLLESLVLLALRIFFPGALSSGMESIGISSPYVMTTISFLGVLGLATGIGMWRGKKWGWWLGALCLSCAVAIDTGVLLTVPEPVKDNVIYVEVGYRTEEESFLVGDRMAEVGTDILDNTGVLVALAPFVVEEARRT
jgi:hypothetical protein